MLDVFLLMEIMIAATVALVAYGRGQDNEADRWMLEAVRRGLARLSVDENGDLWWEWIEEDSQGSGQ